MKTLTIAELQERLSNAVLAALDNEVKALLDHQDARGWTDKELPMLFRGLYPHIHAVASRINEGGEPGAAFFMIDVGGGETQAPFAQSVSTTAPATDKQDVIPQDTLLLVAEAVRYAAIATVPGGSIVDPQLVADEIRGINMNAIIRKFQPAPEATQQAFRIKTSGVDTPDVDVGVEVGDLLHHDHGPNLAEALARLALRVSKFHNLNAPTLTAFAVPTVTAKALPRDLLMEFGAAVRDAAKRADFDIGEDVDIAAIVDRYASQVKPQRVNQQLLTALEGVTLTQEQIDMGTTSSDEQHAVARAAIASVKGGV